MEAVAADVAGVFDGRRSLVLAPHPDDEVLGCGGTIARKVGHGTRVSIVFLTDGRRGGVGSPGTVTAAREAEAIRAAEALGLSADHLAFLGFEDGRLRDHLAQALRVVREKVEAFGPCDVFVPYRREYHGDHLATWEIGRRSLPVDGRLYEYPIWYGPWIWRRLGWRARAAAASHLLDGLRAVKISIASVADRKRLALAAYESQVSAFARMGPWGTAFLNGFLGEYELFFAQR
jgi:LmbE family N-acetylglucosaminyl deacetylase